MTAQQVAYKIQKIVGDKISAVRRLDGASVSVCFDDSAELSNGSNAANVAKYLEYGTRYMPPRPFIRNAVAANRMKWNEMLSDAVKEYIHNGGSGIESSLSDIGETIRDDVIQSMDDVGIDDRHHNLANALVVKVE